MRFEPSSRKPHLPGHDCRPGNSSVSRGDGFAGGCISLIVLLIEIPVAFLLGLTSVIRGWGRADEQTAAAPMDWVPILWFGGFTLGVLVIAVVFLHSAHPFAGAVQLLVAAIALLFTIAAWHDQYERAHPPPSTNEVRDAAFEPRGRPVGPTTAGAEAQRHTGAATEAVMHTQPRELRFYCGGHASIP
ncbi:DUF6234 family protein [Streptomyces violarus]|nr:MULTISPECIES: DUF6234 family protein [Streptomyces]WRU03351.1 DUF6234 family protein [Streptomyces sp. CGMCC 4.1772]